MVRQGSDRPDISERLNGAHAQGDYDALADLFLGNAPAPSQSDPAVANPPANTAGLAPEVLVTARPPQSAPIDATPHGPCCSRVGPIGGAATAKPATRRIEVLVLGHLPGLGGTWAAQQARIAAQHAATPVCLLRLSADQLVVDLVSPDDARPMAFPACQDGASALRLAAHHAGAWLLRLQGTDEAALAEWWAHSATDPAVDRIRLLTGADDAAIVAAYRQLKAWHAASLNSAHAFARLARVTIVEPDAARANAAETRLRKAAASFLETELAPAERLGAMRPVRVTTLYCGPFEATATQTLALVRSISREVPHAPGTANASVAAASPKSTSPAGHAAATSTRTPVPEDSESDAGAAETPRAVPLPLANGSHPIGQQVNPQYVNGHHTGPSPSPDRAAVAAAPPSRHNPTIDQLIAMIARSAGIDTLRAAQTSCPWAPSIVLAVDHQGEFHAIAFAQDDAQVAHATMDLLAASRWCTEHASLLAMASVTPHATETTLHLITTAPAAARRLADTGLRVHAAVRIGNAWGAVAIG